MSFVFLSHRGMDKPRIRPFVLELIRLGIPTWVDRPEEFNVGLSNAEPRIDRAALGGRIELGTDWPQQIDAALMRAFAVIVFWSVNWTRDRDVLTREHGAAHVFHNTGYSTYLPVLLDDSDRLDPEVSAYRAAVHDDVQAFNVARFGEEHWDALLDRLVFLWRQRSGRHGAAAIRAATRAQSIDWIAELTREPRDAARIVDLLAHLPAGPAVDPWTVPVEVHRAFARSGGEVDARLLVAEAASVVLPTFSDALRRVPDRLVVMPTAVPSPFYVPLQQYWFEVFAHACTLGPRMVAALLLSVRPAAMADVQPLVGRILQSLEGSP